jgi:antitoxin component YwqK of YwqJK toxin-antitoxin module
MRFILFYIGVIIFSACQAPYQEPIATETEIVDIWDNGRAKTVRLYAEIDGEREAIREIYYYSDGAKNLEGPLLNGKREGLWKSWYEDGSLWSEGQFRNGMRQGPAVVYYPNGQKMLEGHYTDNERTGLWRSWDEEGRLINETNMSQ